MSQIEKLIKVLKSKPSDFEYVQLRRILSHFGYSEMKTGKTSGSRVRFADKKGHVLTLHKNHPQNELHPYQIDAVIKHLEGRGLI